MKGPAFLLPRTKRARNMRVWFDVLTPKQVLFFQPAIRLLQDAGHDVLATSRHYREVEELSANVGLELRFVGSRGGKDPREQLELSLQRMRGLLGLAVDFRADVAVSVASADCARVAFGLRVKHVAVNDSPHSMVAGRLSLPLSASLLCPWIVPYSAWAPFGVPRSKVTRYKALDPAAWLKRRQFPEKGPSRERPRILVRLEESYAPYLMGGDESWSERVLARIAEDFSDCELIAVCRYEDQLKHIKERFGDSYSIPDQVIDGAAMIRDSDVFVGMGGTMTAEAALLGVPAISAFQGAELYTERFLLSKNLLLRAKSIDAIPRLVRRSLDPAYARRYARSSKKLLDWMEDPAEVIVSVLARSKEL